MAEMKLTPVMAMGAVLLLAGIGAGSFFAAQALRSPEETGAVNSVATATPTPSPAPATPTPLRTPRGPISVGTDHLEDVVADEPYLEDIVNEIEIVTLETVDWELECPRGSEVEAASHDVTRGTVWEIDPGYIPPGATELVGEPAEDFVPVSLCDGRITRAFREFSFGAASLTIIKIAGRQWIMSSGTGPVFPGIVNGKAAMLADLPPQSPEAEDLAAELGLPGLGTAQVIIQEEFGLTVVIGGEMSLAETIRVAEGLE